MSTGTGERPAGTAKRRGRILAPVKPVVRLQPASPAAARARMTPETARRTSTLFILLAILPMFGQSFHYMVDLPPLYYLSKVWPILTAPLGFYALAQVRMPFKVLSVLLLAYVIGVTPAVSMVQLGNGLFDALATTVKVWPFFYVFSLLAALTLLHPTAEQIRRALITLGVGTFAVMLALWLTVPLSAYSSDPGATKLLMYDYERGYRIYMPMFFGLLFLFYLARRFCSRLEWWTLPLIVIGLVLMLWIYKQRLAIAAAAAVIGLALLTSARGLWRVLVWGAVAVGLLAFLAIYGGTIADKLSGELGASLSIRQVSVALAFNYLQAEPMRWLFGVGAVTRLSTTTMADIMGNNQFYLADIGWVGIVFEYGVIGTLLMLAFFIAALRTAIVSARDGDPLTRALGDYVLYVLLTSAVYSVVFTPGDVASIMALAIYARVLPPSRGVAVPA